MGRSPMTLARNLADFIVGVELSDVDPAAVAKARHHVLDTLGCIAFSTELDYARAFAQAIATDAGHHGIPGMPARLTLSDAALIAGTLAAGFELDDVGVFVHPGACVVPAAFLAAAQRAHDEGSVIDGRELLTAVIVGYEVTVRISSWIGFGPEDEVGWHTPAFHGAIGAAAAAARIQGLDVERTLHALACSTDLAGGGLMQARFGSDVKRVHTGRAAQTGVLAARMAAAGIRGRTDVFEDPRWGYFRTIRYRGGSEDPELLRGDAVLDGLGTRFGSFERIALKYYPCTAGAQGIHDNVIGALVELDATGDDVDSIHVEVSSWFHDQPETLRPATGIEDANFSYAYAAAVAAVHRAPRLTAPDADIQPFLDGLADPRVRAMQQRVTFAPSSLLDAENRYSMDTIVDVRLQDGRTARRRSGYGVRTDADSDGTIAFAAVDETGIAHKFRALAGRSMPVDVVEATIDAVRRLDELTDVVPLWNGLHTTEKG